MSKFFRELGALFVEFAVHAAGLFAGEVLGWVICGAIWGIGWACISLVRNYQRPTGVAVITCGILILALAAWRSIKADIDLLADRSNQEDWRPDN